MADDPHNTSDISDTVETSPIVKEDAETTAARRELKQTTISEKTAGHGDSQQSSQEDKSGSSSDDDAPTTKSPRLTPEDAMSDSNSDVLRAQVSSPKKKRAHDELDETRDASDGSAEEDDSRKSTDTATTKSRTDRSEPEKKRHRDRQEKEEPQEPEEPQPTTISTRSRDDKPAADPKLGSASSGKANGEKGTTSASAFASSGFAKLASSSASPFSALGGSGKPSLFGASSSGSSGFASLLAGGSKAAPQPAAPKLSFGDGDTKATAASPFGTFNSSTSKSVFGGGAGGPSPFASTFGGSALGGPRLGGFGKPGDALKSDKPARPFGAPESDAEEEDEDADDAESDNGDSSDKEEDKSKGAEKEKERDEFKAGPEDKKKPKLHKIVVDDGEGDEVTLLAVRAKMYQMEKGIGWKERGAGMLKVNVPKISVEFDSQGNPEPGSFDASVLDADGEVNGTSGRENVRLIMRQDHTLRVILNSAILPATSFQLTQKLKAAYVLFTAFEGDEVKQVQMKLSEANATLFVNLMDLIKRQLSDV
ncbi:hypothetical protein B0T22DRAFT_146840 [Podospora appendiculata]|uniref:RanBD1 domain-containing protein n=1 Tax=Podospora appendiculata TaxID=314037 RepID=A0AAE1CC61_9PEZI|nr:hypothetical protein B0T22DRAFT_146840 [Podospora appendiculata]